jgi:hypothetical protein
VSAPPVLLDAPSRLGYRPHADPAVVCAFNCRHGRWRCEGCHRGQHPAVWRYWQHDPAACDPDDPRALCYIGPYCPHCAELL